MRIIKKIVLPIMLFVPVMPNAWGAVPEVNIADVPLLSGRSSIHPNMVLSLSLTNAVLGAAYRSDNDFYNKTREYIGYFNPSRCYVYRGGNRNVSDGYFVGMKVADMAHECGGDSFSGNFMNWAVLSVLDVMRYALTGGDRIVDMPDMTLLQRAFLSDDIYAGDLFPRKKLTAGENTSPPKQVTPFNTTTLYIVSCRNRVLFSDSNKGGHCDTAALDKNGDLLETDKKLGEYLVRVKVCDEIEGLGRNDLCQKYASGYKPVGAIQRNASGIRFAVMLYLTDDAATRYGGVLRVPMKYVGADKVDTSTFGLINNDQLEWNPSTGVLYANPDDANDRNSTSRNSGVINYLNKFGRFGKYNSPNALSVLYYESIRYLQGRQPTTESFPVAEKWLDPVIAACQRNYIALMGDVNTNFAPYVPGNERTTASDARRAIDTVAIPVNDLTAGQPTELVESIRSIFKKIRGQGAMPSGLSASAVKVASDGFFVYQAGFDATTWSGSLQKMVLKLDDDAFAIQTAKTVSWDAGVILTSMRGQPAFPAPEERKIYTSVINAAKTTSTVGFKWENLTADQKALLNLSPADSVGDGLGEQRLHFLRGVRTLESAQPGGMFRTRARVLGDIVNSNPVYVGSPASNTAGLGYQKFYNDYKDRTRAVYVGANDGMLHAFDAADGKELFAYVPNALLPALNQLTKPDYAHQPYVDGAIGMGEAKIAGKWKTVLASGMGGSAQGLFVLDVTDPSNFIGGSGALFEFTDNDDKEIGNLVRAPVIAKFRVNASSGVPEDSYFIVVPSGLNNYKDDGVGKFDAAASGALFLLSLDKNPAVKWIQNVNYYKFKVPLQDQAVANGMGPPALVTGNNGTVRYAYAGDLQGNLWRFDFNNTALGTGTRTNATLLFVAKNKDGVRQPITSQPKIVFAPGGGYIVLFGTGKFIEDADAKPDNFKIQSFYGIYDTTHAADSMIERSQLALRTLSKTGEGNNINISGDPFTYGTTAEDKRGWYFDFLASDKNGERSVTDPVTAHGNVFFNSLIVGNDPCAVQGGRTYALDTLTGLPYGSEGTGVLSEVGILGSPLLLEKEATVTGNTNAIGKATVKKKYAVLNFGTGGIQGIQASTRNQAGEVALPARRLSWREVLNWQDLRDALIKK
jgi:Tfp pilus tip-associated adhesin PilY1